MKSTPKALSALMVGTGEYTTGYVHGQASQSDKGAGVVALTLADLRNRGKLLHLHMAGTNGTKFPGLRKHLHRVIDCQYAGLSSQVETYPKDDVASDPMAYKLAIEKLSRGDVVIIFTPDNTHFDIALTAISHGCHVLIAKPLCKSLDEHLQLVKAAEAQNVLVAMEVHKRWDPIYADARDQIRNLGDFSYFSSYMSQPKSQLETFRAWAGKSSDISYYLNAHHIDFNVWAVSRQFRPFSVVANASRGVAHALDIPTEDTISLSTQWRSLDGKAQACAIYTASWIAPRSDVHSQQRFHYMGATGEIQIDQAHRGYSMSTDQSGFRSPNPLFMKYAPDADGAFAGQSSYGYRSIEAFIDAATSIEEKRSTPTDWNDRLATAIDTIPVTAILEAGRRSLDEGNRQVHIQSDPSGRISGLE